MLLLEQNNLIFLTFMAKRTKRDNPGILFCTVYVCTTVNPYKEYILFLPLRHYWCVFTM